jgi:hypothetical protein
MAIRSKNWKLASICGWIGCCIGGLAIFADVLGAYVLATVGKNPATVIYVLHILQAGMLALMLGVPSGACACFWGRKGLGTFAILLCVPAIAFTFIPR